MKANKFLFAILFSASAFFTNAATQTNKLSVPATEQLSFIWVDGGTIISLSLMDEVDATTLSVGNAVYFEVYANVTVNGKVVIKAGAMAEGMVKKVDAGCCGKGPSITITVESVEAVDGQRVRLQSVPHILKTNCQTGCEPGIIPVGTRLSARTLNKSKIDA